MKFQKGRFMVYDNGYKADRYIFRGAIIIMFLFLIFIGWRMGFDLSYKISVECNNPMGCRNPFYWQNDTRCSNYEWCSDPYIAQTVEVEKQDSLSKSFLPIILIIFTLAFFINHMIYNRKFKFKRGE